MASLTESIAIVQNKFLFYKTRGISFDWKGFDLSDLFISELSAIEKTSSKVTRINLFDILKLHLWGYVQRLKRKNITLPSGNFVLVFVNEKNQFDNVKGLYEIMRLNGIRVHFITTKDFLVSEIQKVTSSFSYINGFSLILTRRFNFPENSFFCYIYNNLPRLDYLQRSFKRLINKRNFSYVLVGNDITLEGRLLVEISKSYGIRTGTVQHGSINRVNPAYSRFISNDFYLYGERTASELRYLGRNAESFKVVGWPLICGFLKKVEFARNRKSSIDYDILLCLSGVGHSVTIELQSKILALVKQLKDEFNLSIGVKLHPKDSGALYKNIITNCQIWDNKMLREAGLTMIDLFCRSKCCLTIASTSALEALLSSVPVITLDISNEFGDVDFIADGLTYHAKSYDELRNQYNYIDKEINMAEFNSIIAPKLNLYFFNYDVSEYDPNIQMANFILNSCVD